MKYSKIPLAQTVAFLCQEKGIKNIVISPGSRNAPLTISFTENPFFKTFSIVDERCAAFFALGMAQQFQKPVALVCTSGSALLNYYPAIAEAFYSDIPLVVLSADRPIERIDIGDGQTIRQKNVFENHILYSANLYSELVLEGTPQNEKLAQKQVESRKHNAQEINHALNAAIERNGPVHINIPFYEPLYTKVDSLSVAPIVIKPNAKPIFDTSNIGEFINEWTAAKRKLVLVGVSKPNAVLQPYLNILAEDDSVIVLTETTSNIHHPKFFNCIDQLIGSLNDDEFKALQPDILLTFGGMVVSKKIKAFLRHYQPKHHWHIDEKKAFNTYFCLDKHFQTSPNIFFDSFLKNYQPQSSEYFAHWDAIRNLRKQKHEAYLNTIDFSDFKAFEKIFPAIPDNYQLQLGNSSTIRYAQLFNINNSLTIFCNRGTSGIEGSTSTAIGAAVATNRPTVLLTGDLSFFYDSNALWNDYIPNNFRIIVINNGGGGIFRILPGDKGSDDFSTYFETTHKHTAALLCSMYGFGYQSVNDEQGLVENLDDFFLESDSPKLLEIATPRITNDLVLLEYFKAVK
ncbi:2-succinyl-5-enolpyruvyl-6-hydroxy-3-cyclohexene-1-carboxylic-acid synthase [Spongiivirga sp. MCCC 1A20706]|uniref:2-succinyl-5-enolpyruvyl-6-hydroxy-3- cyclohexene-1-carboxylic-acid synthase n=1 Tax=Spongiivirga sp. MCCC 1A20706 TaxID=3160963 RepID=UPI0039775FC3